jgi:Uma2 family endonuclease
MAAQPVIGQQWTVEQYLEMERASPIRHEYIDGRVYAMSGGDQRHSRIGLNVGAALADRLDGTSCQVFNADMRVRLANERDHVYPDVSVSCDPRDLADDQVDFIRYPCLVVEVLSDSTERYDRAAKFDLYRGRGTLREYVLVETRRQSVEVRARGDDDVWTTTIYTRGDDVALHSVGVILPMAAFYRGIAF